MNKPIIGVTPLYDRERESYWMLPGYFRGLQAAGAIPVMLPLWAEADAEWLTERFDGVLFTGGQDVDPAVYREAVLPCCKELSPDRDRMETAVLEQVLRLDRPALGICRGLQFINAALGGSLWQDLNEQRPGSRNHRMERPYDRAEHSVSISGPLAAAYGCDSIGVNSCHHQGIRDLAPSLRPMAVAEDGLTEAVYDPTKRFFWAVQWHPEFFDPETGPGTVIFRAFVEAARETL